MIQASPLADWRVVFCSYAIAVVSALVMGHFLLGIPIQLTDSFGNMLNLRASWSDLLASQFYQKGFVRPLLWAELKNVSRGDIIVDEVEPRKGG